jgi:hypothetical protein
MRLPSVQGSLLDQINALYERIQNGALEPDDLISAGDVRYDQHLDRALEEIYRSRRAHKKSFKSFIPTFDIFRTFSSDQVVLDVGAHWGVQRGHDPTFGVRRSDRLDRGDAREHAAAAPSRVARPEVLVHQRCRE